MPRRRGPLLLIAFLATVIATGGGGVVTPWTPHPPGPSTDPGPAWSRTLTATAGAAWSRHRME